MENRTLKIWGMALFITAGIVAGIAAIVKLKPVTITAKRNTKLKKDAKILFVGDSMTSEYYLGQRVNWVYSSSIKDTLKAQGKTVDILGEGGKTTIWMLQNLPAQLAKKKYDRVYIFGGINDAYSLLKPADIVARVQKMVDLVVAQGGEAYVIVGYNTEKFTKNNNYYDIKDTAGNIITSKQQMIDRKPLYIQYQKLLKSNIKNATIVPEFELDSSMCMDGIHPSVAGHKLIANSLLKDINYEL